MNLVTAQKAGPTRSHQPEMNSPHSPWAHVLCILAVAIFVFVITCRVKYTRQERSCASTVLLDLCLPHVCWHPNTFRTPSSSMPHPPTHTHEHPIRHPSFDINLFHAAMALKLHPVCGAMKIATGQAKQIKLTWLVLGGDPAARSHRVEQFTAL